MKIQVPTASAVTAVISTSQLLSGIQNRVRVHPVTYSLPTDTLADIGKVVALWAYEEWLLTGIASSLMGIGRKESRRTLNGRAEDALEAIRYAMTLLKLQEPELLIRISAQVPYLADLRNSVGHGIWVTDQNTGKLSLQRISGTWEDADGRPIGAKRDTPESVDASSEWFNDVCEQISKCVADTEQFKREIDMLIVSKVGVSET